MEAGEGAVVDFAVFVDDDFFVAGVDLGAQGDGRDVDGCVYGYFVDAEVDGRWVGAHGFCVANFPRAVFLDRVDDQTWK